MPRLTASATSAPTPSLLPQKAKKGRFRLPMRSMSEDRAERTGPTRSGTAPWKTAKKRVRPASMSAS